MPFKWSDKPNPPSTDLPIPVPPGEITYEQKLVANLVNAGGALSYNTPNVAFDIVYEVPTANINVGYFTNVSFNNITVNTATISNASINVLFANTANISNANILYGFVGGDPTSNLGIASRHYVLASAANVPSGGSDLQNLIDAKGDLLVGTGFHTATRLPIGSNDQILISNGGANSGLKWITIAGQEIFYDLLVQTHFDLASNDHVVILRSAREIVMNDGTRTSAWVNQTADIEGSGLNGLDTGVEQASRWYEVHAIRKSTTGDRGMLLHLAENTLLDVSFTPTSNSGITVRKASGGTATKVSQSFIPGLAGPLTSVELEISKTGSPTGLIWVTLEGDDGTGMPNGTTLSTSRMMNVARLPTDKARMRFLFDTNTSVSLATSYHIVYQGDYTVSDSDYTTIWGLDVGGYGDGRANEFRNSWFASAALGGPGDIFFKTFVKAIPRSIPTMPSGYDQRCLISYVYNDSNKRLKQYAQRNRTMVTGQSLDWRCFNSATGLIEAVDLGPFIPPVPCSVYFSNRVPIVGVGSTKKNICLGAVACTDLPITDTPTSGQISANTTALDTASIVTAAQYGVIILEDQVILCRAQNTNVRIYVTGLTF